MTDFLNKIFKAPPFPVVDLGSWAKVSGTEAMLKASFEAVYFEGVKQGLIAGFAVGVLIVVALFLWRSSTVQKVTNVLS